MPHYTFQFLLMKSINFLLACVLFSYTIVAQENSSEAENIVPNPGFEKYSGIPLGWFYKGKHFTDVMKYWNAPTGASPDIFGPKVIIPKHWAAKGFGEIQPRSGKSMVGITVYGCEKGKPHCREYLQIQLKEPLVAGQNYYFEFWVKDLSGSLKINNLGAYFSIEEIKLATDARIDVNPHVNTKDIIKSATAQWKRISGKFTAKEEANYLILGNFHSDKDTQFSSSSSKSLNYAYYYIDDVLLKKEEPILAVPVKEDDLSRVTLEEGKVVTLKNIFFETGKYELLPRSYIELNKLLKLMRKNPNMAIELRGHTDIRGKDDYNKYLSRKRAKSVVLFLIDQGVNPARMNYKGFGSTRPIATNNTPEGRHLNRRVAFKILSNNLN